MYIGIIISLAIGIFLGFIAFILYSHVMCNIHGPNSKDIIDRIYKKNGKCYKFKPVISFCPISISMKPSGNNNLL